MKIKRTLAAIAAAAVGMTAVPTLYCSAECQSTESAYSQTAEQPTLEFAVLMWTEKDGELTITGCSPMYSSKVADYPTANVVPVIAANGVMRIPSHICGKPVVKISGIDLTKNLSVKTVIVSESVSEITDNAFSDSVIITTTEKEYKVSPIYV